MTTTRLRNRPSGNTLELVRYAALFRGLNLGGHHKVAMADLRRLLEELGMAAVTTYLQSGNAAFETDKDRVNVAREIERALADEYGFEVATLLRTNQELEGVVAANPYSDPAKADPTKVHAVFLSGEPTAGVWAGLDGDRFAPEEFTVGDGVVYLHLPNGMGRSKLATALGKLDLGVATTTRNWRTVLKLAEMTTL